MELRQIALMLALARRMAPRPEIKLEKVEAEIPRPKTEIRYEVDRTISGAGRRTLIDETGKGELSEFVVVAESSSYRVIIYVDGKEVLNATWSEINELSQELREVNAFTTINTETGEVTGYGFNLINVKWQKSFRLEIVNTSTSSLRFKKLMAKWEVIR